MQQLVFATTSSEKNPFRFPPGGWWGGGPGCRVPEPGAGAARGHWQGARGCPHRYSSFNKSYVYTHLEINSSSSIILPSWESPWRKGIYCWIADAEKKNSFAYKHQTGVVKTSAAATVQELELHPPPPKKKIIEGSFPCPLHTLSLQSDKKSLVLW